MKRVFNRIRNLNKTDAVWFVSVALFVLVSLWVISVIFGGPEGFMFLRYKKAGTGAAADLPKIESQQVYKADGVTVTVNSFGLFENEPALVLTAANKTTELQHIEVKAVTVNNQTLASYDLKSDRAENVITPARFGAHALYEKTQSRMKVGMFGVKRAYLVLKQEDLAELGIDTVEEITLHMSVGLGSTSQNVVVTVKTNAAQ